MSRGFVKESDQEELPIVPPRADLPDGLVNYVTPFGYAELLEERNQMLLQRESLQTTDENEHRIATNFIHAKLRLLDERIASAKIITLAQQPQDEVRFGATVSFQVDDKSTVDSYQIVGVDEANIAKHKIAYNSPIAKILVNQKVGDTAVLKLEKSVRKFKIVAITY